MLGDVKGAIADFFQSIQINPNEDNRSYFGLLAVHIIHKPDRKDIVAFDQAAWWCRKLF
jgi:hypothetical protein